MMTLMRHLDGLNLYAFCAMNPVMYVDPSGYSGEGRSILGNFYDEAVRRHQKDPEWYGDPDKMSIIQGDDLAKARDEYVTMTRAGKLEDGHHKIGLADGGLNVPENIMFTGEAKVPREMVPDMAQQWYVNEVRKDKRNKSVPKQIPVYYDNGKVEFGLNPKHSECTAFQNKIHKEQRKNGLRTEANSNNNKKQKRKNGGKCRKG